MGLLTAGTSWAQDGRGSIVGWSSQVGGVDLSADFAAVAGGGWHLGLKTNGSIVAWGRNDYGQCSVPPPNTNFIAVAGRYGHSLGIEDFPRDDTSTPNPPHG